MDDLDRLIDDSYEEDAAAGETASHEPVVDDVDDTTSYEMEQDEPDSDAPVDDDESEDGEAAPDEPGVTQPIQAQPTGPSQQEQALQIQVQRQQHALQQLYAERQRQQAQAEVEALEARLAEMDPEEAGRERLAFVSRTYQQQVALAQQEAQRLQYQLVQLEEERHRPVAVQKAIDYYKLSERDRSVLMEAVDADQLDRMAQQLQLRNQQQTQKARQQKAQNVQQNAAHRAGGGGKPSAQVQAEPTNLDELVDSMMEGWPTPAYR